MNTIKRGGNDYAKSKRMSEVFEELYKNNVLFMREPQRVSVEKVFDSDQNKFVERHYGYDRTYATFWYKGYLFYVQASSNYPYPDDANQAPVWFMVHDRVDEVKMIQRTYPIPYESFDDIENWIISRPLQLKKKDKPNVTPRKIDFEIGTYINYQVKTIVETIGGAREKLIWSEPHFVLSTETWNDEHKVVKVILADPLDGDDGSRRFFEVDLISKIICG